MPIRFFSDNTPRKRRSRRKAPATRGQREALQTHMESAFKVSFTDGIAKMRNGVSAQDLEKAFRAGDYTQLMASIPLDDLESYMQPAIDKLAQSIGQSAAIARTDLPPNMDNQLRLTTQNEAMTQYLNVRTGALIQGVQDDTQVMVQNAVRGAFTQGLTPADVAAQIKNGIGLTDTQAESYKNFQGTKKEKAALLDRLQGQRANMVARTEISAATNQGQLSVYKALEEQGLVPPGTKKVWIVDGSPCPKICDPMDGIQADIGADFMLPDGVPVPCPPAHPNCRCLQALDIGDSPSSNRQNYANAEQTDDGGDDGGDEG